MGGWDIGVVPASLTGTTTSPLHADAISIAGTSAHPDEAFAVLTWLLGDPAPRALWSVAPAATSERAAWYANLGQTYPGVEGWEVADTMLRFPDVPSHQSDFPGFLPGQQRLAELSQLLSSEAGADLDVDAALDELQADLQAMADDAGEGS